MNLQMLKCKLHRATVTEANLNYEGSITIDSKLCDAAGLLPFEQVDIVNCNNGQRLTTYVIYGGEGEICLNGAAARLVQEGDKVIIMSYAHVHHDKAPNFEPKLVFVDDKNNIKSIS